MFVPVVRNDITLYKMDAVCYTSDAIQVEIKFTPHRITLYKRNCKIVPLLTQYCVCVHSNYQISSSSVHHHISSNYWLTAKTLLPVLLCLRNAVEKLIVPETRYDTNLNVMNTEYKTTYLVDKFTMS